MMWLCYNLFINKGSANRSLFDRLTTEQGLTSTLNVIIKTALLIMNKSINSQPDYLAIDSSVFDTWLNSLNPKYRDYAKQYTTKILPMTANTEYEDIEMTNILAGHFEAFLELYLLERSHN